MTDLLHRDSSVPLYQQLEEILKGKIANGDWAPDQRIPSENELNRMFGLSRMTVRGVLTKLVNDGLLLRVAGKGTYVSPPAKISAVSPAGKASSGSTTCRPACSRGRSSKRRSPGSRSG